MTPEVVSGITERYIELYENITGEKFNRGEEGSLDETLSRIGRNVTACLESLK